MAPTADRRLHGTALGGAGRGDTPGPAAFRLMTSQRLDSEDTISGQPLKSALRPKPPQDVRGHQATLFHRIEPQLEGTILTATRNAKKVNRQQEEGEAPIGNLALAAPGVTLVQAKQSWTGVGSTWTLH